MNKTFLPTAAPAKTVKDVEVEWDDVADLRRRQLAQGHDLSFDHVLAPSVFGLLSDCDLLQVADLGCGTGVLTAKLAAKCEQVVGIDLSSRSIAMAREDFGHHDNLQFRAGSVERFADVWRGPPFTVAVANMTLMDCLDLDAFLKAASRLLVDGGALIATVTHPFFWPRYWGYDSAEWFSYAQEIIIESPFRISTEVSSYMTTHVHRPLSMYVETMSRNGLSIERMIEPIPSEQAEELFPSPWEFPRFLVVRACKRSP